ncbi:hypothetical protein BHE74_00043601 [Ensete ventricosum]|nr:hypothetical protein BHE74_00043601 [Ensete ventricosum]
MWSRGCSCFGGLVPEGNPPGGDDRGPDRKGKVISLPSNDNAMILGSFYVHSILGDGETIPYHRQLAALSDAWVWRCLCYSSSFVSFTIHLKRLISVERSNRSKTQYYLRAVPPGEKPIHGDGSPISLEEKEKMRRIGRRILPILPLRKPF